MLPKFEIEEFIRVKSKVNEPITKFGGQPIWLTEPQWPISRGWDNRPMMFIAQIALDDRVFEKGQGKMAYIFVTQPQSPDDDFFDPDIIFPDEGENAVIIQPEGEINIDTVKIDNGPTLFDENGETYEAILKLKFAEDPYFIDSDTFRGLSEDMKNKYVKTIDGNKIGGAPNFFQGDEWPDERPWLLLLQLNSNSLPSF